MTLPSSNFRKKNNRESGPAVVGLELKNKEDLHTILTNLKMLQFQFDYLNDNPALFNQLIG